MVQNFPFLFNRILFLFSAKVKEIDDTKAFQVAWATACKVVASTVVVLAEFVFLVEPISFFGP